MKRVEISPSYRYEIFVSYSDLFPEENVPDVMNILRHYSRKSIINIIIAINNNNSNFENCAWFFSNRNQYIEVIERYKRFKQQTLFKDANFIFTSSISCLELLRYSFSTEPVNDYYDEDLFEWELFKALLIINQQTICRFNNIKDAKTYQLLYLNNLCYIDIIKDLDTLAIQQHVYAFHLFEFLEVYNYKTRELVLDFEDHYGTTWQKYLLTLMSAHALSEIYSGKLDKDLHFDVDKTMTKSVLEKISLKQNKVIKYASETKNDRDGNSDYRFFKEKPIIDIGNYYVIYSSAMLLSKIYNGLFFDLKMLCNKNPKLTSLPIRNIIQEHFFQNTLSRKLLVDSIKNNETLFTENMMKKNRIIKVKNELGPPDFIIKGKRYVVLIECKDIKLNGWVKEQKDYQIIIEELEGKILGTKQSNHKGIGQLVGFIKNIRNGCFTWLNLAPGIKIYPVLLLSDPAIIQDGFYGIALDKFKESLHNYDVSNLANNRELIVMSPITLLKYSNLFKEKGLPYYFELYYKFLKDSNSYEISFDKYMSWKKFNKKDYFMHIIKELRSYN